jgi:hypothetical protein
LGNAANVTFLPPSPYALGGAQGGTSNFIRIQFASDDQLAAWLPRQCTALPCRLPEVRIRGSAQTWDLTNVTVTQIQTGAAIVATMAYQTVGVSSTPVASSGGTAPGGTKAGYDISTAKSP